MDQRRTTWGLVATLLVGCEMPERTPQRLEAQQEVQACRLVAGPERLAAELYETSGLARGVRDSTRLWTHNDGREAVLYALGPDGAVQGSAEVPGVQLGDWEDLESGRCGEMPCLLLGDLGDNDRRRREVAIHEVSEPEPGARATVLRTLRLRYPDGAQDAEALFALPDGTRYIVTKGRHAAIALYRAGAGSDTGVVTLERVRELAPQPTDERERVTGATASPSGSWVAIRTYHTLRIYTAAGLLGGDAAALEYDLRPLREEQGEGIALADDGTVWLSSESETGTPGPTWLRLSCTLPAR